MKKNLLILGLGLLLTGCTASIAEPITTVVEVEKPIYVEVEKPVYVEIEKEVVKEVIKEVAVPVEVPVEVPVYIEVEKEIKPVALNVETFIDVNDLLTNKLTRSELLQLKTKSFAEVRTAISTIKDAARYIDLIVGTGFYSAPYETQYFVENEFNAMHAYRSVDAVIATHLTGALLADDYGDKLSVIQGFGTYNGTYNYVGAALLLKTGSDTYKVVNPGNFCTSYPANNCIANFLAEGNYTKDTLNTVAGEFGGFNVVLNSLYYYPCSLSGMLFTPVGQIVYCNDLNVNTVFVKSKEQVKAETIELDKIQGKQNYNRLLDNYTNYNMPESFSPTLSQDELLNLVHEDLGKVQEKVKTVGDAICFFAMNNYKCAGYDLNTYDPNLNISWHYNCAPEVCYEHNYGCCGTTSGLVAYLLKDDYDVVGMGNMTFAENEGGGHIINYVEDNGNYYLFDCVNLVGSGYDASGFNFTSGKTKQDVVNTWCDKTDAWHECVFSLVKEIYNGDIYVGWPDTYWGDVYYDINYKDSIETILIKEDFSVLFVNVNEAVVNEIIEVRNTL